MNSLNSDKYKLTTEENNKQNIPEDINNKYVLTDKENEVCRCKYCESSLK